MREDAAQVDPYFKAITSRRSSKVPFDLSRPISAQMLNVVRQSDVTASVNPGLVAKLRGLTWDAWMIEAQTPRTFKESVDLMRIGKSEIEANPDGISLGGAMIEALARTGQISRASLADPTSSAFKAGIESIAPSWPLPRATPGSSPKETLGATSWKQVGVMCG